jgi:uncharacterized protein (TIGR04255 family)
LKFGTPPVSPFKELETVVRRLKKCYPHAAPLQAFSVKIDATGGNVGVEQQSQQGFQLSSDEQTDVVIIMPTGVATSRLATYPSWPVLRERAEFVWQTWLKSTPRLPIARLGIRTINRIDVPLDQSVISLETFLNFYPQVPDISPAAMVEYMMQVTVPTSVEHWTATITSTPVKPPALLDHMSLLLDIDIFRTEKIPSKGSDLWAVIDDARAIKNDIFERCITDETRRLIS